VVVLLLGAFACSSHDPDEQCDLHREGSPEHGRNAGSGDGLVFQKVATTSMRMVAVLSGMQMLMEPLAAIEPRRPTLRMVMAVNPHGTRGSPARCPGLRVRPMTTASLRELLFVGLWPLSARLAPVRAEP
jgi:hypothetical protein